MVDYQLFRIFAALFRKVIYNNEDNIHNLK